MASTTRSRRARRKSRPNPLRRAAQTTLENRHRRSSLQIHKNDAAKVGFGDLPAELRNQVYTMALMPSSGESIRIVQHAARFSGRDLALGLLCSCKAVRKEAWSFFYELNEFRIDCIRCDISRYPQVLQGYGGSNPVFAAVPPSVANYEADLSRFIKCTNNKYALHSIRTISFAYYDCDPTALPNNADASRPLPECAAIVIILQLLPKRPFYSIRIDFSLSQEKDKAKLARAAGYVEARIRGMYELETGGKRFTKIIVEDIARTMEYECSRGRIGK